MLEINELDYPLSCANYGIISYLRNIIVEAIKLPYAILGEKISVFMGSASPYSIALNHIVVDGVSLQLVKPITANVAYLDDLYFCQNSELEIVSASSTLDDCMKTFQDEVLFVLKEYGQEEDSKLTSGARELKRKILQHFAQ